MISFLLGLVTGYGIGYFVMLCTHIRRQRELGKQLDVMIAAVRASRLDLAVPNAVLSGNGERKETL